MARTKIKNIYVTDDEVVSPTQNQMDLWTEAELAKAEDTQMLSDEVPTSLFAESNNESID